MADKKIDILFGVVIIVLLLSALILINDFNAVRANDLKEYSLSINSIVQQKNNRIRQLYAMILEQQRTIQDLKSTLSDTRNSLDSITSKLPQQTPVATTAASVKPAAQ